MGRRGQCFDAVRARFDRQSEGAADRIQALSIDIRMSDRPVRFARAVKDPVFKGKRAIASTPWEYVSLWLRQNNEGDASIYWRQAKNFFDAARDLPAESAALPLYYSFLNATKALLEAKNIPYAPYHGVSGFDMRAGPHSRIRLENEGIKIKQGGVLPSLISYFGEVETRKSYNLAEILSNLPFIHRAYAMSYGKREIYLSIERPRYVRAEGAQARFEADIPIEHSAGQVIRTFPASFRVRDLDEEEWDESHCESGIAVESVDTFAWSGSRRATDADIAALCDFHRRIRLDIIYISGAKPVWYLKRNLSAYENIRRNTLTMMFMAMHRVSEIARYKPVEFNKLLSSSRNWLIFEFIRVAQNQFIDEIAAEITGLEVSPAGVRQSAF